MNTKQETRANATTAVFGSEKMLTPAPTQNIPQHKTTPEIAYQMVKDETYPQTQPRLNLATFVTTYMDEYATRLMNEAINVNYIDETEYPRVAVMCGRCINIIANMWNSPEKAEWKTGALGIGSSEACMLGGVAAWLRWRAKRKAEGKPFDKPNLVMSSAWFGRSSASCGRSRCARCPSRSKSRRSIRRTLWRCATRTPFASCRSPG